MSYSQSCGGVTTADLGLYGVEMADEGHAFLGEGALDQVHPGRACRREVQLEAGMPRKPGHHLGLLVGGIVVENKVIVARVSQGPVDATQECQELLGPVAWRGMQSPMTRPDFTSSAANRVVVPWRL